MDKHTKEVQDLVGALYKYAITQTSKIKLSAKEISFLLMGLRNMSNFEQNEVCLFLSYIADLFILI